MVRVADGAGERIGGIGLRRGAKPEQRLHHVLNLLFAGVALAHGGDFEGAGKLEALLGILRVEVVETRQGRPFRRRLRLERETRTARPARK